MDLSAGFALVDPGNVLFAILARRGETFRIRRDFQSVCLCCLDAFFLRLVSRKLTSHTETLAEMKTIRRRLVFGADLQMLRSMRAICTLCGWFYVPDVIRYACINNHGVLKNR